MRLLQIGMVLVTAIGPRHAKAAHNADVTWDTSASLGTGQFVGSGFGSNGASFSAATSIGVTL